MGCCSGFMKWTIIVLNVLVFLMGLVAVGFGIYVLVDKSEILDVVGNTPDMPAFLDKTAIILIVGGTLIAILAMIGICGAYKSNKRLLCVYGVILAVIMTLEIVIVILAVVYRGEIDEKFKSTLLETLRTQYVMPQRPGEGVNDFSSAWDSLQYELECCGVQNHIDYRDATFWHTTDKLATNETVWPVPRSCCKYSNPWEYPDNFDELTYATSPCYPSWNSSNTWTYMGCQEKVKDQLHKASFMIIGAAAVTAVTQILLLLFALALYCGWCGTKEVLA